MFESARNVKYFILILVSSNKPKYKWEFALIKTKCSTVWKMKGGRTENKCLIEAQKL